MKPMKITANYTQLFFGVYPLGLRIQSDKDLFVWAYSDVMNFSGKSNGTRFLCPNTVREGLLDLGGTIAHKCKFHKGFNVFLRVLGSLSFREQ